MGCGCGKRKNQIVLANAITADGNPDKWGPPLWTILHILAERIGNNSMDASQAHDMGVVVSLLPSILPCATCQGHMRQYIALHPFVLSGLGGADLRTYCRTWLLNFHNAVRSSKDQPLDITTLDQLSELYGNEKIESCDIQTLSSHVIYGIRVGLSKMDIWKRGNGLFQRLKVMVGA